MDKIEEMCRENITSMERMIAQGLVPVKNSVMKNITCPVHSVNDDISETLGSRMTVIETSIAKQIKELKQEITKDVGSLTMNGIKIEENVSENRELTIKHGITSSRMTKVE